MINVTVTTTVDLTATQREKITKFVEQKITQEYQLTEQLNPELLGGVIIKIGSQQYDLSLRGKLTAIRDSLSATTS